MLGHLALILLLAGQAAHVDPVWQFDPADRAKGDGGPAPKRDFTGTWAGPRSGAGVPDMERGEIPVMTEAEKKLSAQNRSLDKYSPAGTNDPTVRTCDPFGFPRVMTDQNRAFAFATMPGRIILMAQFQGQWREIWMDGRELPKNVGSDEKDSPDPRYYGYSVGHWEDDYTLVVDTTGVDDRTWLNGAGLTHTVHARFQERFKRTSHNDMEVSITVDDPELYQKPFTLVKYKFRWIPNQMMDERLCIASDVIEYLNAVGDPAGSDPKSRPSK